ncbi:uncharacterized protein At4g04775-like [Eutrema salsugineum]|uniref:uncharacterized protein At4g04775-like n=1 Tax=Eutrema salsugineum TaxID=72664 RepID=UPI000CED7B66|nr:uncharacterized protein At4g04775-like [Eutrema salsugineum]
MGQYRYTQPSSSSRECMSSTARRRSGGNFGFPIRCYCGLVPMLQTSSTDLNPGRRFYGCHNNEDGGYHIFKWWDEAMTEELQELRLVVEQHADSIRYFKIGDCKAVQNCIDKPAMEAMHCRIMSLDADIAQLRDKLLESRFGGLKLIHAMVAGAILIAVIVFLGVCLA